MSGNTAAEYLKSRAVAGPGELIGRLQKDRDELASFYDRLGKDIADLQLQQTVEEEEPAQSEDADPAFKLGLAAKGTVEALRSAREARGSVRAVAEEVGISYPTLSLIERGQRLPSASEREKLEVAFGRTFGTIMLLKGAVTVVVPVLIAEETEGAEEEQAS